MARAVDITVASKVKATAKAKAKSKPAGDTIGVANRENRANGKEGNGV